MMSSVASFNDISRFIPGLTRYRYSLASLHRLQYGSGYSHNAPPFAEDKGACKLDAEVVAREMRTARGADGVRLF